MSSQRRVLRAVAAVLIALGSGLVAAGAASGVPASRSWLAGLSDPAVRVPATDATWVAADEPAESGQPTGQPIGELRAGDTAGGAVTYLKFEVPAGVQSGWLELTSAGQPLPGLVELVAVPDTGWQGATLTWPEAPVLGPVVASATPEPGQDQVAFDVSALLAAGSGAYAFAVTVPPDQGYAVFAGGGDDQPVLRLPEPPTAPPPTSSPAAATPPPISWRPVLPEDAAAPRVPPGQPPGPPAPSPAPTEPPPSPAPTEPPPSPAPTEPECVLGELLVPTCGVLWGVAPDAHTGSSREWALAEFERTTGRQQDIYHAYHRAQGLFPTAEEVRIADEGRILFLNWKPLNWSWAQIAAGHPTVDAYLDRLAAHINSTFTDQFFFTIHHEPENNVRDRPGSGFQAADYAAMYRHVVERLRARGVDNLVTVMNHMAYVPWNAQPWFPELYPGDDVVDWIAWNTYAYSDPGYGHGDFAEMLNRRSSLYPAWPGFYNWATALFPHKPFMIGEWGVWHSRSNPGHMARFYESVGRQTPLFPRVKAMVYFDTPADQRSRDSRPTATAAGLAAFQELGTRPYFQVRLDP